MQSVFIDEKQRKRKPTSGRIWPEFECFLVCRCGVIHTPGTIVAVGELQMRNAADRIQRR